MKAIIPARALIELARIAADGEQTVTMVLPPGRGQVLFHLKDSELGFSIDRRQLSRLPGNPAARVQNNTIVSTPALLKACKQAEIIASEGNYVIRLEIVPGGEKPGQVEISAQSEETGSSEISVEATIDGPPLVIAFNVKFLREVLEVVKSPSIAMETNANNTPGMLRPVGDQDFQHVIMPMHLG
jgi:DNA polymerase III subunit beta